MKNRARHCEPLFWNFKFVKSHAYLWRSNLPEYPKLIPSTLSKVTPFYPFRLLRTPSSFVKGPSLVNGVLAMTYPVIHFPFSENPVFIHQNTVTP